MKVKWREENKRKEKKRKEKKRKENKRKEKKRKEKKRKEKKRKEKKRRNESHCSCASFLMSWSEDGDYFPRLPYLPLHPFSTLPIPSHPIPSHPIASHRIPSHPIPSHSIPFKSGSLSDREKGPESFSINMPRVSGKGECYILFDVMRYYLMQFRLIRCNQMSKSAVD